MKSTGIVRAIDQLGRLTIPVELRRSMEITSNTMIEIYVENERVILKVEKE